MKISVFRSPKPFARRCLGSTVNPRRRAVSRENFELFRRAKLRLDCIPSEVVASAVDRAFSLVVWA
jgi:hypothetical protein